MPAMHLLRAARGDAALDSCESQTDSAKVASFLPAVRSSDGTGGLFRCRDASEPQPRSAESAHEFRPQVEPRTVDEHGVVGDERNAPVNPGGRDPQINVVGALVERVANQAAMVPEVCDRLDRIEVDRQHPDPINKVGERPQPALAPACIQRAIASLGDRLRSHSDTPADGLLDVLRLEQTVLRSRAVNTFVSTRGQRGLSVSPSAVLPPAPLNTTGCG
jgi:hypothetical protein